MTEPNYLDLLANTAVNVKIDDIFEKLCILNIFSNKLALTHFKIFAYTFDNIFYKFIDNTIKELCHYNKIKYNNIKYKINKFKKVPYTNELLISKNIIFNMSILIDKIKKEANNLKIPNIHIINLSYKLTNFVNILKNQFKSFIKSTLRDYLIVSNNLYLINSIDFLNFIKNQLKNNSKINVLVNSPIKLKSKKVNFHNKCTIYPTHPSSEYNRHVLNDLTEINNIIFGDILIPLNKYNNTEINNFYKRLCILNNFSNEIALDMFKIFAYTFDNIFHEFINRVMVEICYNNKIKYNEICEITQIKKKPYPNELLTGQHIINNMLYSIKLIVNKANYLQIPKKYIMVLLEKLKSFVETFKNQLKKFIESISKDDIIISSFLSQTINSSIFLEFLEDQCR